jgi:hypothetical protein
MHCNTSKGNEDIKAITGSYKPKDCREYKKERQTMVHKTCYTETLGCVAFFSTTLIYQSVHHT